MGHPEWSSLRDSPRGKSDLTNGRNDSAKKKCEKLKGRERGSRAGPWTSKEFRSILPTPSSVSHFTSFPSACISLSLSLLPLFSRSSSAHARARTYFPVSLIPPAVFFLSLLFYHSHRIMLHNLIFSLCFPFPGEQRNLPISLSSQCTPTYPHPLFIPFVPSFHPSSHSLSRPTMATHPLYSCFPGWSAASYFLSISRSIEIRVHMTRTSLLIPLMAYILVCRYSVLHVFSLLWLCEMHKSKCFDIRLIRI